MKSNEEIASEFGIKKILLIQEKWLDLILHHGKRVELRSRAANFRGKIGLGWRGKLCGHANLVDCFDVDDAWKRKFVDLHMVKDDPSLLKKYNFGWLLDQVTEISPSISFDQPNGCVVWISLDKPGSMDDSASSAASSSYSSFQPAAERGPAREPEQEPVVHVLRTSMFVMEKMLNGLSGIVIPDGELPSDTNEFLVAANQPDVVGGKVTLGPAVPAISMGVLEAKYAFSVPIGANRSPHTYRPFVKVEPFVRTLGTGRSTDRKTKPRSQHQFQKYAASSLRRTPYPDAFFQGDSLPEPDLLQVARSFMQALSGPFQDRLRLVACALHGARVRLATTCSGVDSMPSILQSVFRQGLRELKTFNFCWRF